MRDATEFDLVIVGAGISGCVFAERALRELVEKRSSSISAITGNCYDFVNGKGFRVSQYGVHLFHTRHEGCGSTFRGLASVCRTNTGLKGRSNDDARVPGWI